MANLGSDPNRHWDGSRWLQWDGHDWRDSYTGEVVTASSYPATSSESSVPPPMPGADSSAPTTNQAFAAPGYYRTNMTAFGVRSGTLAARIGEVNRLTFTADDGDVVFDGPLDDFHSLGLAEWDSTLEVWQGGQRHRVNLTPGGPVAGSMVGAYGGGNTDASRWYALLQPYIGQTPQGVKVRKPMGRGTLAAISAVVVVLAIVFAIVVVVLIS